MTNGFYIYPSAYYVHSGNIFLLAIIRYYNNKNELINYFDFGRIITIIMSNYSSLNRDDKKF